MSTNARQLLRTIMRPRPGLLDLLGVLIGRARQRGCLAELDGRLLEDIGVSREQALTESDKPFWRR